MDRFINVPASQKTDVGTTTDRGITEPIDGNDQTLYNPSNVVIDFLEINHPAGRLDLQGSYHSIVITESVFEKALTCKVVVLDATEKLAELDLDGSEELKIGFHSEKNKEIVNSFKVYRVETTNDDASGSKGKAYQLFGISEEFVKQSTMDINKAFTGTLSKFVEIIYDFIGSKKQIDIHRTTGRVTTIIPGMTPFESIEMIQRRSYNARFSSSIFLFYEDTRGFNFVNMEQLIAEGRNRAIEYSYKPGVQLDDMKTLQAQRTISEINFPRGRNLIDKIKSGAYASQVAEIDVINQRIDRTILTVKENFNDFYHLDKPAITLDKTDIINDSLNVINSTTWINKYVDGVRHRENNFGPALTRRKFYADSLGQIQMNAVVPGNSDLNVGMVMDLDMIESSANKENPDQEKKISGKYLITEVNHQIIKDKYNCTVACNKESYRANVDDISRYVVGKR